MSAARTTLHVENDVTNWYHSIVAHYPRRVVIPKLFARLRRLRKVRGDLRRPVARGRFAVRPRAARNPHLHLPDRRLRTALSCTNDWWPPAKT